MRVALANQNVDDYSRLQGHSEIGDIKVVQVWGLLQFLDFFQSHLLNNFADTQQFRFEEGTGKFFALLDVVRVCRVVKYHHIVQHTGPQLDRLFIFRDCGVFCDIQVIQVVRTLDQHDRIAKETRSKYIGNLGQFHMASENFGPDKVCRGFFEPFGHK